MLASARRRLPHLSFRKLDISSSLPRDQREENSKEALDPVEDPPKPIEEATLTLKDIDMTWAHYMDWYSQGDVDLSVVEKPEMCECEGLMMPPPSVDEYHRLKGVSDYMFAVESAGIKRVLSPILKDCAMKCSTSGSCISLLTQTEQVNLAVWPSTVYRKCPRVISFDAHVILSKEFLIIKDTHADWRLKKNPLVIGSPFIRFYCGVPMISNKGDRIGVLSVFDAYPRPGDCSKIIEALKQMATEILATIDQAGLESLSPDESVHGGNTPIIETIGRATCVSPIKRISVFLKDGSGSSYTLNHNIKFGRSDSQRLYQEDKILKKRLSKGNRSDIWYAANVVCDKLAQRLNLDFIYIMEIRVSERSKVSTTFLEKFREEHGTNYEKEHFTQELTDQSEPQIITRLMGASGYPLAGLKFEPTIHLQAFNSALGIHYNDTSDVNKFRCGVCMPFFRDEVKYKFGVSTGDATPVRKVCGGYLISAFCLRENAIDDKVIESIFSNAVALRRFYM